MQKVSVVTGANRGIGLELCKQLKEKGKQVVSVCRTSSEELNALNVRVIEGIDVSEDTSIKRMLEEIGDVQVEILMNNAGILSLETLEDMNFERISKQFEVNSIGPLRVTTALLPMMQEGSKIALFSSQASSITNNTFGSRYGYRMSKAALNMAGASLALDLKSKGIPVAIFHPGHVRTDMGGPLANLDSVDSVLGLLALMDKLSVQNTGTFWDYTGEVLPW